VRSDKNDVCRWWWYTVVHTLLLFQLGSPLLTSSTRRFGLTLSSSSNFVRTALSLALMSASAIACVIPSSSRSLTPAWTAPPALCRRVRGTARGIGRCAPDRIMESTVTMQNGCEAL